MAVKRWALVFILTVSFLLAACSPANLGLPYVVTVTPSATSISPSRPLIQSTQLAQASDTPVVADTPTLELSPTIGAPVATDTLLPPLELPTEKPSAPAVLAWTGEPTYPGDSQPGRLFRVNYDPDIWAQTGGDYGGVVLAHRQIPYCTITPLGGRGLAPDWKVEHNFRVIGSVPYDVNTVIAPPNVVKYVMYVGGDQLLLTGFQVSFQDQQDQCIADAETVLSTLLSFAAQPTITPTSTPIASATP